MKLLILLALAVALHAEDAKPSATAEQFTTKTVLGPGDIEYNKLLSAYREQGAKVAEQQKEMAAKDQQIAKLSQKLTIYQQSAFRCQDAMLDAQIDAQRLPPAKDNAQHATPVSRSAP